MSDNEWLNDLKVGDKIYVCGFRFGVEKYILSKIIKITPKGTVKIKDGSLFKNGSHKTDSWHWDHFEQYTPELEAKIKAEAHYNHMCYSINAQDMRGKPLEQVQKIYDILNENDED